MTSEQATSKFFIFLLFFLLFFSITDIIIDIKTYLKGLLTPNHHWDREYTGSKLSKVYNNDGLDLYSPFQPTSVLKAL
jgi:hypothetical protein